MYMFARCANRASCDKHRRRLRNPLDAVANGTLGANRSLALVTNVRFSHEYHFLSQHALELVDEAAKLPIETFDHGVEERVALYRL